MSAASEAELRRKMCAALDEKEMATVGRWFLEQLANGVLDEHAMTPFEKAFMNCLTQEFNTWMKMQTHN
jgi:hypothetical protein